MKFLNKYKIEITQVIILAIPNIIVWCILFPGYFQADHQQAIAKLISGIPDQGNSLIWAIISLPLFYFTPSYACYGLFQIAMFVFCTIFGIWRLRKCGFIKKPILFTLIMAFTPTFLLYNELYSSELWLAYFVFVVTCILIEYVMTNKIKERKFSFWLMMFLFILACCLIRKTAVLIPIILVIVSLIFRYGDVKKIVLIAASCFAIVVIVDFGFSKLFNTGSAVGSKPFVFVPSYQIAGVYAHDGYISEESRDVFEKIKSPDEWSKSYLNATSDDSSKGVVPNLEFAKAYFDTGFNNLYYFIKAYFKLEAPFYIFSYNLNYDFFYRDDGTTLDFYQHDWFTTIYSDREDTLISDAYSNQFGVEHSGIWNYTKNAIDSLHKCSIEIIPAFLDILLFNRSLPLWTIIIGLVLLLSKKQTAKNYIIVCAPIMSILFVFLVSCPVVLFRYTAEMYYALPLLITFVVKNFQKNIYKWKNKRK